MQTTLQTHARQCKAVRDTRGDTQHFKDALSTLLPKLNALQTSMHALETSAVSELDALHIHPLANVVGDHRELQLNVSCIGVPLEVRSTELISDNKSPTCNRSMAPFFVNVAAVVLRRWRVLPGWVVHNHLQKNPKWPDEASKNLKLATIEKGHRGLLLILCIHVLIAFCFFGREASESLGIEFSSRRVMLSFANAVAMSFALFADLYMVPPMVGDATKVVQSSPLGPLAYLTRQAVYSHFVYATLGLFAEVFAKYNWAAVLIAFTHHAAMWVLVMATLVMLLFLKLSWCDPEYQKELEPHRKQNTGAAEMELFIHIAPCVIAHMDVFLIKQGSLMWKVAPRLACLITFFAFYVFFYIVLTLVHAWLSGGCFVYPFMKQFRGIKDWSAFCIVLSAAGGCLASMQWCIVIMIASTAADL